MNDQLTNALQQLADKLGTTVEFLWGVLLRQAYVKAATNIAFVILSIVASILVYKLHVKFEKKKQYKDNDLLTIFMFTVILVLIVVLVLDMMIIADIVTALVNPEYWALRKLFGLL